MDDFPTDDSSSTDESGESTAEPVPRDVVTRIDTLDDDDLETQPVVSIEVENPAEEFWLPEEVSFVVWLDAAFTQSDSIEDMCDCVVSRWIDLYCQLLCGGSSQKAVESVRTYVEAKEFLGRAFRAEALASLASAQAAVDADHEELLAEFRNVIESRVDETDASSESTSQSEVRTHREDQTQEQPTETEQQGEPESLGERMRRTNRAVADSIADPHLPIPQSTLVTLADAARKVLGEDRYPADGELADAIATVSDAVDDDRNGV